MMDSLQQQAFSSPHQRKPLFPQYLAKVSLNDMIIENHILSKKTGRDRQLGFLSIYISFCPHLKTAEIFLNSIHFLPAKLCAYIWSFQPLVCTYGPEERKCNVPKGQKTGKGKGGITPSTEFPCWKFSVCWLDPSLLLHWMSWASPPFPAELSQLAGSRQLSWEAGVASRYCFLPINVALMVPHRFLK